jgi:hypothetical protein
MSTTNFSHHPDTAASQSDGSSDTKDQAKQAAGTAADEGKRVAGVAKDEAQRVGEEAKTQVRALLDDATSQVDEQSRTQKAKLAETVRTFGEDLDSMTSHGENSDGMAAALVQQVADQAKTVATHLDGREPRELLDDVRAFARRRPGTFLLGALAAGVVVGRLTRGAKEAQADESPSEPTASQQTPASTTLPASPAQTDLGPKGVEMSESGIITPGLGGRA